MSPTGHALTGIHATCPARSAQALSLPVPTLTTQWDPAHVLACMQSRCSFALTRRADGLTGLTHGVRGPERQGAEGHADVVRALACTPQGLVFSASYDRTARAPACGPLTCRCACRHRRAAPCPHVRCARARAGAAAEPALIDIGYILQMGARVPERRSMRRGRTWVARARAAGVHRGAGWLARRAPAAQGRRRRNPLGLPGRAQQLRARRCAEEAGQGGWRDCWGAAGDATQMSARVYHTVKHCSTSAELTVPQICLLAVRSWRHRATCVQECAVLAAVFTETPWHACGG